MCVISHTGKDGDKKVCSEPHHRPLGQPEENFDPSKRRELNEILCGNGTHGMMS